jgi:geranylgeranyl diphosphate synthase type I
MADDPAIIDTGAAFELLHAFALVHDDVMDGSSTRRGEPTIHSTFDAEHSSNQWNGESRRFGEGVAILVGDLAEVYADRLMSNAPQAAFETWNELKIELNIGQFLDVLGAARGEVDLTTARRIVRYKSGKYTIERPLHVGAALAGRLDELQTPLSRYGEPLGEAFQLRDDILGTFGDSARTGSPRRCWPLLSTEQRILSERFSVASVPLISHPMTSSPFSLFSPKPGHCLKLKQASRN